MQATKDTFYITLRDRLVQVDSDLTIVVDGATRPALEYFRVYRPIEIPGLGISSPGRCPREAVTRTRSKRSCQR